MAQFKRFNASENDNYASEAYPNGTLTWDPDNGLRLHDGSTSGGNPVLAGNTISTSYSSVSLTENGVNITTDTDVTPGGKTFEFRDTGVLVLPSGGDIQNASGNSLIPSQSLNTSSDPEFSGLYITGSNNTDDNEGGELRLGVPVNSFGLSSFVSIDVYQNRLRIFENGVTARGVYLDLTKAAGNVGTDLMPKSEPPFTIKAENFTAEANTRYGIDTLGQARTVFLPASPVAGTTVFFVDALGSFNINSLTLDGNGKNIMGSPTLVASTANQRVGVFYNGGEWRTY